MARSGTGYFDRRGHFVKQRGWPTISNCSRHRMAPDLAQIGDRRLTVLRRLSRTRLPTCAIARQTQAFSLGERDAMKADLDDRAMPR